MGDLISSVLANADCKTEKEACDALKSLRPSYFDTIQANVSRQSSSIGHLNFANTYDINNNANLQQRLTNERYDLQTTARITHFNNEDAMVKQTRINDLVGALFSSIVLIFIFVLYKAQLISVNISLLLSVIVVGGIVVLVFVVNKNTLARLATAAEKGLLKKGDELQKEAAIWANDCDCDNH